MQASNYLFIYLFIYFLVILAPYGLAGVITGQTYKESDPNTQRLLDDWRQLYVLKDVDLDGYNRMPPAVEVVVGELRPPGCDASNTSKRGK